MESLLAWRTGRAFRNVSLICSGAAALGIAACQGAGSTRAPSAATAAEVPAAERGRSAFEAYCSDCHGTTARGDGPLAAGMRPAPADLTRIARRRGSFGTDRVAAYIDGRTEVASHGRRGMPVWGRKYDDRLEPSLEEEMRLSPQMIADIVTYLQTQQAR